MSFGFYYFNVFHVFFSFSPSVIFGFCGAGNSKQLTPFRPAGFLFKSAENQLPKIVQKKECRFQKFGKLVCLSQIFVLISRLHYQE
jgi:hypothetical protein